MDGIAVSSSSLQLLQQELERWPAYGARANIETATAEYALLLTRNRSLEVRPTLLMACST